MCLFHSFEITFKFSIQTWMHSKRFRILLPGAALPFTHLRNTGGRGANHGEGGWCLSSGGAMRGVCVGFYVIFLPCLTIELIPTST